MKTKTEFVIQIQMVAGLTEMGGQGVARWFDTKHVYSQKPSAIRGFETWKHNPRFATELTRLIKRTEEVIAEGED